jgi:uncharacterized protein (TIGR04255 family)
MARYLPFAGRNSIVEMNIGIQFASPFDQRIGESIEAIKAEFAAEFPKFDPLQMQMITINFGVQQFPMGGTNATPTVGGFNLTKAKADGSVARVLRVMSNVLSVHFLEYSSWKETKPQAISYVTRCLEKLAVLDRNPAIAILLRYIDRFTFDGAPQDAKANTLFRSDTKFVASRILDSGYQWHSNSGWFEPLVGASLVLNQLNVASAMTQTTVSVVVDHNSVYSIPKPYGSVAELTQGNGDQLSLEAVLDLQHRANADLLKNLLNQEMLDTIGLKG